MKNIYSEEEIRLQRIADAKEKEELWAALAKEAGGGERGEAIKDAFKQLYTLYVPEMAEWFAKLYDPATGGYYSTTSGHDTEGFGPDVEVTVQSLRFIESSGMIRGLGSLKDVLPEKIQKGFVRFAKSLQNPNGFFYHPQWSFDDVHYNLSRRGRDLGWATCLLEMFGGTPTYDTPNGRKGDGLDVDGNPVKLTFDASCDEKESKADAPAAAKNYPEYMENKETFLAYLNSLDLNGNSYWVGNQFNATYSQMRARSNALLEAGADYSLCDVFINFLNSKINPETGYWGDSVNLAGTNGFFKIITIYNAWGYIYPMPEKVTEAVLHNILGDELARGNCCSIYNLWSAICSIKANVRKNPDEALRDKVLATINETLREKGADAILNTYKKMAPYQKNGKHFSHSYDSCGGSQQGLPTGLTPTYGVLEGNVDATCICSTGLTRTMFEAFGFTKIPMLMRADWMNYRNILETYGPAKKIRTQDPLVTFDDGVIPNSITALGNAELTIKDGKLLINAYEEGKGVAIRPTARICKGNAYLLEADAKLSDITGNGGFFLGVMQQGAPKCSIFFNINVEGDTVSFSNEMWDTGFTKSFTANGGEFKLRIEFFLDPNPSKSGKPKCTGAKVYANGEYLGTAINNDGTDPLHPTGTMMNGMGELHITALEGSGATIALDNLRYYYATL